MYCRSKLTDGHVQHSYKPSLLSLQCRKPRLFSGLLSAVISGSLAFTFLEPLFVPVGMNLAVVALYVLAINAAAVGMSLGVLLPTVTPGASLGVALSLLIGTLVTFVEPLYFPIASAVLAIVGAVLSAWYVVDNVLFDKKLLLLRPS